VVVSHTVADALAHNRRLQTAVLDYRLPDSTGLDVARELRARDPSIEILFISGHADDLGRETTTELGVTETLEKPVDTGAIVSWVQIALEKSRR
jgi:DNA-binding response OmpR family regulator